MLRDNIDAMIESDDPALTGSIRPIVGDNNPLRRVIAPYCILSTKRL